MGLQRFMEATAPIAFEFASSEALRKAGWLPHYTTPIHVVAACAGDTKAVRSRLLDYYTENWQEVRSAIESRLSGYSLDEEAKETFREALNAHERGLYRCVCRVLFPEIDQMFRAEIFNKAVGHIQSGDMTKRLVADESIGAAIPGGICNLDLFRHLTKTSADQNMSESDKLIYGLFRQVITEDDRERVKRDPVPNRHAAMHGLVVYSSQQNSLNMIFMADYIFGVISELRENSGRSG